MWLRKTLTTKKITTVIINSLINSWQKAMYWFSQTKFEIPMTCVCTNCYFLIPLTHNNYNQGQNIGNIVKKSNITGQD